MKQINREGDEFRGELESELQDDSLAQQAIHRYIISVALLRESIAQIADYDRNEVLLAILILQVTEVCTITRT